MSIFKPHWSIPYFIDRAKARRWEKKNPGCPWFTRHAVRLLEDWIKPTDTVLEYGSGRSTAWFAARARRVISVEQSPQWYEIVKRDLDSRGLLSKVDLRLVSGPESTAEYSEIALEYPEKEFEIVIIDGHFRRECLINSLTRIKEGGILVYDDCHVHGDATDRAPARKRAFQPLHTRTVNYKELWTPVFDALKDWRLIWTTDGVKDTSIWIRPVSSVA